MRTKVRKWGNSLALRLPKTFVDELGLEDETGIEMKLSKGRIVVATIARTEKYSIKKLAAGIKKSNLHDEVDTGKPMGREVW
ncbi:MAG: AbrB/MazE/SpoVT family DNA-binding domain-containing protein [Nitrospinota bacterium]